MKTMQSPFAGLVLVLAAALTAGSASAQQATYQVRSITPEAALKAAQAALAICAKNGHQVAVTVTDRAGHPLVMLRDRHAGPHTPQTATSTIRIPRSTATGIGRGASSQPNTPSA